MVILQEMELSGPKMKNVLIFPKKMFSLYSRQWNFIAARLNNFRTELSELEKLKKTGSNKILIFHEIELSCSKLEKLIYFLKISYILGGSLQSLKNNNFLCSGE